MAETAPPPAAMLGPETSADLWAGGGAAFLGSMTRMQALQAVFCILVAVQVMRTLPALVRFYEWFVGCGLDISRHRGMGQTACRVYGLVQLPKLSVGAMCASGVAFAGALLAACLVPLTWQAARVSLLVLALATYFLFFGQLYCEAHVGAHVTVLIPPAIVMLATTAGLDPELDPVLAAKAGAFTAWLMKVVITVSYCGAGMSKLHSSLKNGRCWFAGPTMQACIFEALFMSDPGTHTSFGVPTPFSHRLQRLLVQFPRLLCAPLALYAVLLEALAPLALLAPAAPGSAVFAVLGLGLHYGICITQNIDFVSWWSPPYAFFLFDPAAAGPAAGIGVADAFAAAAAAAPWRTGLAVAYVAAHCLACAVLRFFPEVEILPFSAFMMYSDIKDLYDPSLRATVYLSEKPHATGTLKNYCFPFCRPHVVTEAELPQLHFKYFCMRHGGGKKVEVMTNAVVTEELAAALWAYRQLTSEEPEEEARAAAAAGAASRARRLMATLDEAKAAFRAAPRSSGSGGGLTERLLGA